MRQARGVASYPFYLAFENSDEHDYVSEKVFHALEAGVLPIYNGAPNVDDFVPPHSVVDLKKFGGSLEKLAKHLHELLDDPERYLEYFAEATTAARGVPAQVWLCRHTRQVPTVSLGVREEVQSAVEQGAPTADADERWRAL